MSPTPPSPFDLSGRAALVTGGGRGLGRSITTALAFAGCDVAIASRDVEASRAAAAEIAAATGRRIKAFGAHVGRWDTLDDLVDQVLAEFGGLDVLVNNAGMSPTYATVLGVGEELFDKVLGVNLKGPFRLAALVGSHMAERGRGSIINISSAGAVHPRPDILPYAAAKAGLNAITVGLAHTFGPPVRVNAIMAGTFATDVSKHWPADVVERRTATFAARRIGQPDEIAGAAVYLASDASSYTTGTVLTVDGGQP